MTLEKNLALVNCYEWLERALDEITYIDIDDDRITDIQWEIKNALTDVDQYLKYLNGVK